MSIKALQDYTFYSRYAKHIPELKRREQYRLETVPRVFNMHREKYKHELNTSKELQNLFDIAEKFLANKSILGSQRALQFGGDAILNKNERIYNCSSTYIDRPKVFQDVLFLLLCGVGIGFSTQYCHVNKLPKVVSRSKNKKEYIIEDSIEGWANAVGVLLSSYFESNQPFPEFFGYDIEFDFSKIRPKGSLISWGGIAPGPDGLKQALNRIIKLIDGCLAKNNFQSIHLAPIHCYDILMHLADSVLAGGIRRSACINLFSPNDEESAAAKTGDWIRTNPQRARSNNSALLIRGNTTHEEFNSLFTKTREFGEPGFVWADHQNVAFNPCCEIGMWPILENSDGTDESGFQFCNLTEINGKKANSKEHFYDACKAASILGTIQAGYTSFPYLGSVSEKITKKEALLGVSITGMMDNPEILFDPIIQRKGAQIVKKWNKITAKLLGINVAARTTCVKPSGHSSCILGTASGIHPQHSNRYFRRVQANKLEFPAQYFKSINPMAVEPSVWNSNSTDEIITFLCEVPSGSKVKNKISALELLEHVKTTQTCWVESGTNKDLSTRDFIRHNVSNTITVKDEEWDDVRKYIYRNRKSFAGISLLPFSGDKDYPQAPFCAVFTPSELVKMYGDGVLFASGLIVDGLACFENNLFKAADTLLGIGEIINYDDLRTKIKQSNDLGQKPFVINTGELKSDSSDADLEIWFALNVKKLFEKRDWIRRAIQFAKRYFNSDIRQMTYCLKDVSNWKKWCDLSREYKDIDWVNLTEESHLLKANELAAQGCMGNKCEL